MPKVILACALLAVALVAFGQHKPAQPSGGKIPAKSKPKPKPTPKPKATDDLNLDSGLVWVSPCGVYYKNEDDQYITVDKWVFIGQTKTDHFWYNPSKSRCDSKTGVLKTWIKEMHRDTDLKYALALYELKCAAHQLRVTSITEYDKEGSVLESGTFDRATWEDIVPDSMAELVLKTVCRL